jgi:hypothetical protein
VDEADWLAYADSMLMPGFLRGEAGERKLKRFGCACRCVGQSGLASDSSRE